MGIDRFVYWRGKGRDDIVNPSVDLVKQVLEDYLGGAAIKVYIDENDKKPCRVMAVLTGRPSFPFRRIYPEDAGAHEQHDERWIEVYVDKDSIDIITRMTDEYTNVVAEGFAVLAARFWKGKREKL